MISHINQIVKWRWVITSRGQRFCGTLHSLFLHTKAYTLIIKSLLSYEIEENLELGELMIV